MAFNHRKMITYSIGIHISEACELFCDSERNRDGYCPTSCLSLCPSNCYKSFPTYQIPPPDPPTSDQNPNKSPNFHLLLIISLSILATTCFLFCCYTSFKYFQKRVESRNRIGRRRSSERQQEETHGEFLDQDHGPVVDHPIWYIRTIGLQSSVINSIAICKYKRGEGLVEGTECSVCLNEFEEDETLRLLPKCNHAFHIPCIDTWLRSHTNCPLCRAGIVGNAAGTPTPLSVQAVDDPAAGEENQVVVLESGGEGRREREDRECDLRRGIEDEEGEREVENGGKGPGPEASKEEEMVQPMRRSVSMDSVSASMLSLAIANSHLGGIDGTPDSQKGKSKESDMGIVPKRLDANHSLLKLVGSSSISMKRSLSSSGKVFFSRYGRGWNPSLP